MRVWDLWKKGFYAWEDATARLLEQVLRSPAVLQPSGLALKAFSAAKAAGDGAAAAWWARLGLPTRRDQERALHRLNEIESRLADLEEALAALAERAGDARTAARAGKGGSRGRS